MICHTLYTTLQITASHVHVVSRVVVTWHTLYTMLHITTSHVDMACDDLLHLVRHVAYIRSPCKVDLRSCHKLPNLLHQVNITVGHVDMILGVCGSPRLCTPCYMSPMAK